MLDKRVLTAGAVASAVIGLGASIASAIDDLGPAATFCAESGCETVRSSVWARPLGVPMSLLGIAFFGAMLALGFVNRPRLRRVLAVAGGAWAVWLIVLQAFVIGAWCKLCLVADPAAIALAACVVGGAGVAQVRWSRMALLAPGLAAVVLVLAAWVRPAGEPAKPMQDVPAFVAQAQAKTGVTIVEVVDFECPHCREMQRRLDAAIAKTDVPVTLVRKMMPLPGHPGAIPAALAYCCADAQGKGDAMARALFEADPSELTAEGCERIAARIGCDLERYRRDIPSAKQRVLADFNEARAAEVTGLPTLYIGSFKITGTGLTTDDLVAVIEDVE
jgi:uncharacterized membrane protein/predicted DsbA family dithiol-disulfide isomerase